MTVPKPGQHADVVVVPNHLPHLDFLSEWTDELAGTHIIVVQDGDEPPALPDLDDRRPFPVGLTIYTWANIERDLGENAWIIPRRTSAIRSYGFWKAWQTGAKMIMTLDNDCYPVGRRRHSFGWVEGHQQNLHWKRTLDWAPSWEHHSRGFPYKVRDTAETWLSHGLWAGSPDFDAIAELECMPARRWFKLPAADEFKARVMPRWNFFPMCGMNLAFDARLTPAMWFGLFGPDYGFDQFDDIWAGVLAKKVLDVLGKAAVSGQPLVEHRRQSDPFANLRKQAPGLEVNEHFWQAVAAMRLPHWTGSDRVEAVASIYSLIARELPDRIHGDEALPDGYFARFKEGARIWAGLFA